MLEQTQEELARERQHEDEAETMARGGATMNWNESRNFSKWKRNEYIKSGASSLAQKDQEVAELTAQVQRLTESSRVHMGNSTHHEPSTQWCTSILNIYNGQTAATYTFH